MSEGVSSHFIISSWTVYEGSFCTKFKVVYVHSFNDNYKYEKWQKTQMDKNEEMEIIIKN